ncbi:MAG: dipeptide/oligopeptide/nickel ABC transporter ATP-binding protein [Endomicrobium sp.]|jgi:ABC-type glutathione transport system ATPase component|nr:dipeptide/oligopeptide/nickel ABC transporter ATP-binding protein [Endomicrobium sp.]
MSAHSLKMNFLEINNLSKIYTVKTFFSEKRFLALDGVSFSLKERESLSIIGSSGSGKTTLGRIIAKILEYDGGEIKFYGKNINDYSRYDFSKIVQMIFQNPYASLNPKLKIKSSLSEALDKNFQADAAEIIGQTLVKVGLESRILNNYPHQFSGGQRQKIAIARALLKNPKLIIADEPFASLDVYSQNQITSIFKDMMKSGVSIILITHDISAARQFAQRMIVMDEGKIVKDDSAENVFKEKENKYIADLISAAEI